MKKTKSLFLLAFLFLLAKPIHSQSLIAVQNGNSPKFYSILQDAINNAQIKDTIYIPGGPYSFTNSTITIDKELHLIGAGHHADSIAVTGTTQLNASIHLITGSNNSTFEGFILNGNFYSGKSTNDEDVDNITISRCICSGILLSQFSTNWLVRGNIIRGIVQGNNFSSSTSAQNNIFSNNVFEGLTTNFGPNNIFRNNIFLSGDVPLLSGIDGCIFQNNIIVNFTISSLTSCIFDNNLYFSTFSVPVGSISSNNITNQTNTSTFVNQTGSTFSYSHNYHLQTSSPGKNAGKDGTDIGIYGGAFPWKEGAVPSNPHFQSVKINPITDSNGKLSIKFKVAAQDY